MNELDILYTPLATPTVPATNIEKLLAWIEDYKSKQTIPTRQDASEKLTPDIYPWNIIYPKFRGEWQFEFDKQFPELSEFFSSAYGLAPEDVNAVVMLPMKSEFAGLGFWHSDPDAYGLRMYIENEEPGDFLLIKPTIEPYDQRPGFGIDQEFPNTPLQPGVIQSAKLLSPRQTFYINNVRAVHAVLTEQPGTLRIAVIISVLGPMKESIKKLIVDSANTYKDHAVLWTPMK